jgi:hypothetical protein
MTRNGQPLARYGVTEGEDQIKDYQCTPAVEIKRVHCRFSKESVIKATGAKFLHKSNSTYAILATNLEEKVKLFSLLTGFTSSDENDDFRISVEKNFTVTEAGMPLTSTEFRERIKKASAGDIVELYSRDNTTYEYNLTGNLIAMRQEILSQKDGALRKRDYLWDFDDLGRLISYKIVEDNVVLESTVYSYAQ